MTVSFRFEVSSWLDVPGWLRNTGRHSIYLEQMPEYVISVIIGNTHIRCFPSTFDIVSGRLGVYEQMGREFLAASYPSSS